MTGPVARMLALSVTLASVGCECGDDRVAELESREGAVDRSLAAAPQRWTRVRVGDGFFLGDAVRTGDQSRAELSLDDGGGIALQSRTILRFVAAPPGRGGTGLRIDAGEVELEVQGAGLSVATLIGTAWIERGSVARLRSSGGQVRLDVRLGQASLERDGAAPTRLAAGEHTVIAVGGAILEDEPSTEVAAPPIAEAPAAPAAPVEPPAEGPAEAEDASPVGGEGLPAVTQAAVAADVAITAGESPTIHDTGAPTAVRIRFGGLCAGEGVVRIGGSRVAPVRGRGAAVFPLGGGAHRYSVSCVTDGRLDPLARATGTILVRRDSGAAPLQGRVPHNAVDADGRRYTVLYQSRLPSLTFQWSDPEATGPFVLHVQPEAGAARVVPAPGPRVTLASGELAEGRYRFWFAGGAGRRSADTSLRVGFDNAAPTAWLRDVDAPGASSSTSLRVAGAVLEGWTATVNDRPLALDENNRFEADLAPGGDERAVAIRIARPGRGVHYYLRRPRGAGP